MNYLSLADEVIWLSNIRCHGLAAEQAHQTRTATTAPFWYALLILLRYRTKNNYMSLSYLGSRLLDKAIYTFLIFTFYWHVGKNLTQQNVPNIGGMLFFW